MATTLRKPQRSLTADVRIDGDVSVGGREALEAYQSVQNGTTKSTHGGAPQYGNDAARAYESIRRSGIVAVDLETTGLSAHETEEAAIGAVILRADGETFVLRKLPSWWPAVLADASVKKIGHNLAFDLQWMIEFCPAEEGQVHARNLHDTMLKSQLVHDYRTKSGCIKAGKADKWQPNDLAAVLAEFLGVTISKAIDHDVTDWTGPWSDKMIEYMLEDIEYLEPLNMKLDALLLAQGQERASWIEQQTVFAIAWMSLNGITPDAAAWGCRLAEPYWHQPNTSLLLDRAGHTGECTGAIAGWRDQHRDLLRRLQVEWPGVDNYNSPQQLVQTSASVLGGPLLNTKKATLKQLASSFPAVATLLEQRHLSTRLKNWGLHFLEKNVCPLCSRFHPHWRQIGTETSRPSCSSPNLMQIPRAPEFRSLFIAAPGTLIASLDYSAIEVLTAGVFANEPRLIAACRDGDPHLETAKMMAGNPHMTKKSHPQERQSAKIANFGLLFGGGVDGLVMQARDLFDTVISREEAQRMVTAYFNLYPGLKATKNMAYRAMEQQEKRVEIVNQVGFRRFLEGFNRKPTSWLNTWIQSTAAYGMKASFTYLQEDGLLPFLLGQVYDELLFEFPEDRAMEYSERAKLAMTHGMKDVLGANIPVHVSIDVGRTWV